MLDFVEFGKRVRDIRINKGLTLEQAAELCCLSSKGLENIELGLTDPKLSTVLMSIMKILIMNPSLIII